MDDGLVMPKDLPDKDPTAPKRNVSAYLLYQNVMRDEFKAKNPSMTFGELSKYTSARYAELPPDEKEAWVARANADKARYLEELSKYTPPPGYDAKGDLIVTHTIRRGRTEKDRKAPKRNLSPYLLYQNAMRKQFKKQNPDMTFGQIAQHTSMMFKSLSPEEKAKWELRAKQDKGRYEAEISEYVPPPGHDARGVLIVEEKPPRKRAKRGPKDPAAPKRASGAYVFYTSETRPKILEKNPGIKFIELGKLLGEMWRELPAEEKKVYEDLAAQDKARWQFEMEQYNAALKGLELSYHPMPSFGSGKQSKPSKQGDNNIDGTY